MDKSVKKFKVSLTLGKEIFKTEGGSLLEALDKLKPGKIVCKGIINVSYGKLKTERCYHVIQVRRFIGNQMSRIILSKALQGFLK